MMNRTIQQLIGMLQPSGVLCSSQKFESQLPITDMDAIRVRGVTTDSRGVQQNQLFVPLIGDRFNGHDYVRDAFAKGASVSFWQTDQGDPPSDGSVIIVNDTLQALQALAHAYRRELQMKVIAVTGSNGKTTTKDVIAHLLNTAYVVHKTQGNFNNHIGLPLTILQCNEQTQVLVAEMGMSGRGEISLLSYLAQPDVAVITMIGEAHIEQLGSRESIAEAKMEIVDGLASDGLFIYNGDEPLLIERLQKLSATMRKVSFGLNSFCDYVAVQIESDEDGTTFQVNGKKSPRYHIPLLGIHNVSNVLAAIAVAEQSGIHALALSEPLARLKITGMRTEKKKFANGTVILNDAYNASPTSVRASLKLIGQLHEYRRKVVVLGDMLELGHDSEQYHRAIGSELEPTILSEVYTFGDMAQFISQQAVLNFPADSVHSELTKEQIAQQIAAAADAETVILVKGSRGMKLEEVVERLEQLLNEKS